jgi:alpha-1,6-mannosyltransferase
VINRQRRDCQVEEPTSTRPFRDQGEIRLRRIAVCGFAGLLVTVIGASAPGSPFQLSMSGTWFLNAQSSASLSPWIAATGIIAVFGGIVVVLLAWYRLTRMIQLESSQVRARTVYLVFLAWSLPILLGAPMFSRDIFSYAAQGEMIVRHINPYTQGPSSLASGPYLRAVDPLWRNTPSPYGPLSLIASGAFARLSHHSVLVTVALLRGEAFVGVALTAICVPKLAAANGSSPAGALVLTALNPVVLLTLIAGGHNDALMIGLMMAGITISRLRHPLWGIVLCSLAACVKIPALLGVVWIAWDWTNQAQLWRAKISRTATVAMIAAGVVSIQTLAAGLGWGWIRNLGSPGENWVAPTTGLGIAFYSFLRTVGLHLARNHVLLGTRCFGDVFLFLALVYLVTHSKTVGFVPSLGLALLLVALMSPIIQPWYLSWGLVVLGASVPNGQLRSLLIIVSVMCPFLSLPGGVRLVTLLSQTARHDLYQLSIPLLLSLMLILLMTYMMKVSRVETPFQFNEL